MFVDLTCAIIDASSEDREELAQLLASQGVAVIAQGAGVEKLNEVMIDGAAPRLVVVKLDPRPVETLARIGSFVQRHRSTAFFVMSASLDAGLLMEAIRLGVREFVPLPVDRDKLLASIERVGQSDTTEGGAKIVQFIGASGGCGVTTIACNVGAALARNGKALLVDMDLVNGAAGNAFDLRPRFTIADLMDPGTPLDRALVENAIEVDRGSGLHVLCRPEKPEDAERVDARGLTRLLRVVSKMFDYVLIDGMKGAAPFMSMVARVADVNVLVMQLDVPGARNSERLLSWLQRCGVTNEKIKVVINRFVKKGSDVEVGEVEKLLGTRISWMVPNDFRSAIGAINVGKPAVLRTPRAEMSDSLCGLSHLLNGKVKAHA